jgi:RNA polymerase sigma factor (TIGR02999 family)
VEQELEALIRRADQADREAADKLFAILYQELHRIAERNLHGGGSSRSLGTTTLLHEAYLNIPGREAVRCADRPRFLAYASRAMRGLVIDYARSRRAKKRGREFQITLADDQPASSRAVQKAAELERLGDALDELAELEPALAELVDLHFFCGFSFVERSPCSVRSPTAPCSAIGGRPACSSIVRCSTTTRPLLTSSNEGERVAWDR